MKDKTVPVAMREGEIPVPIPNTTVKTFAADGTMLETAWESRRLPGLFMIIAYKRPSLNQVCLNSNLDIWKLNNDEAKRSAQRSDCRIIVSDAGAAKRRSSAYYHKKDELQKQ